MQIFQPPQILQTPIDPEVIDLGLGNPPPGLLPLEMIRRAAEVQFVQNDSDFLQYGAEMGDGYLRRVLAAFLSRRQEFQVDTDGLLITSGASSGLDLICTLFTKPGDTIFVEEPSYFLALRIFADHRLHPVGIPVDANGLEIAALEDALRSHRPALVYTIPTFQNPSGLTLSAERRSRLVELSREFGFLIVADEVYQFLDYLSPPPVALAGYAAQGNVISLGSFSKILAPGLRLGWMQTDIQRAKRLAGCGLLDSGGGFNPFTSAIIRWIVENGQLDAHIDGLRATYTDRSAILDAALRQYLPQAAYHRSQGGYFFWARLPDGIDAVELLPYAERFKVGIRPGVRFSCRKGLREYMRLCFAYYSEEEIVEGVRRLAGAVAAYRN